ncbi:M24 family metallopeptidase [Pseudomonas sp. ZM23]|uniref:M24 family metallopeptidase n=1 Tax=Pseudomonas triclosanedens TaxID=2961893 RepID=A0ABY7A2J1_9PSED|nr:M24 family metallopeptidase [Pseudomonas triclosanedens]MCP8467754.1 M24 family metallopeptidase [Pseudomonas triclosanedens]MCP8473721.1 M24 family metallopeptidase [Pseudomonas triclosanedens]MCP8479643.1 M24 family metallopeptidase [Pseudomonas triclosanedens]WAI51328.1 M24 family metallopeptidase [Pseudomonas triclosanedens]
MSQGAWVPTPEDLRHFRDIQQLAYRCCETIAGELRPGISERETAALMKTWLLDHGVRDWFHQPFAWFGPRTSFKGFDGLRHLGGFNLAFYPGKQRLEEGMPFILDCAPTLGAYTADVGYSGALGSNLLVERLMDDLLAHRNLIVEQVRQRLPLAEVSQSVDRLCQRQGTLPRHKAYPFEVLAHRVEKLGARNSGPSVARFGVRNIATLMKNALITGRREGWSPLWSSNDRSRHAPTPGLWAVEPHLGLRGVGAKFEELLVVTEDDAYWLDDDLPHVRRWLARGLISAPARREVA